MKRFLTAILAVLFLVSATGTTVHLHYCMGKLVSADNHLPKTKHKCARCGMVVDSKKSNGCCKDEVKTFKTSDHQKTTCSHFASLLKHIEVNPVSFFSFSEKIISQQADKQLFLAHAPPERLVHCPQFILLRNIRI
jgi:hypothetical protein